MYPNTTPHTLSPNDITPQEAIPPHIKGITVSNHDNLIFLGNGNLRAFLRYWRKEEYRLIQEIARANNGYYTANSPQAAYDAIVSTRHRVTARCALLLSLLKHTTNKPLFPTCRTVGHFKKGEEVVYFTHGSANWSHTILPEQQHHLLSCRIHSIYGITLPKVQFPVPILQHADPNDILSISHQSAHLLKDSEYHYFRTNPDYLHIWIASALTDNPDTEASPLAYAITHIPYPL